MKNPVTTITGAIMIIGSALVLFGVITPEQETTFVEYAISVLTGVSGLISMFAGDPGRKESGL